jgi:hypothetical protein
MKLVDAILSGNLDEARELIASRINEIIEEKLQNLKLKIVAENYDADLFLPETISHSRNIQKMGRVKLVRLRVRKGKIQRRKKFSTISGYTIRGGRMVRMSPAERIHRKRGARRAKIKIRIKRNQIMRKRNISLRKRRAIGLR